MNQEVLLSYPQSQQYPHQVNGDNMIVSMPVQQPYINQEFQPNTIPIYEHNNVHSANMMVPMQTPIMCIQQLDPSYTPKITDPKSPKGKFTVKKDSQGRTVIKQPFDENKWMIIVGISCLFCLPCLGVLILYAIYKTLKLKLILNDSNKELIISTVGVHTKKETKVTIPYANIASLNVVMDQSLVPDGLPNGKFFIITKDQNSLQVRKDAINYYSMANMAQKATDLINERLNY